MRHRFLHGYLITAIFTPAESASMFSTFGVTVQSNEAMKLWDDENRIEMPARTTDESRFLVIGRIAGKH